MSTFTIVGQGLAGTCLAWELWKRKIPFQLIDRERGGSSRVAAGLINPITGKAYELSHQFPVFHESAMTFYEDLEDQLGLKFWHPMPILRLAATEKEWNKMQDKASVFEIAHWIVEHPTPMVSSEWEGRVVLRGGGRLDTKSFLDASREFFREKGCYQQGEVDITDTTPNTIWCEGAVGLMADRYGEHRCAKGEILTVEADWPENAIRIGTGGWLIPLGDKRFKVGATYEWDELDEEPTDEGRKKIEGIAARLGGPEFTIVDHQAGIRPILRRSQPLIGPIGNDQWMFNALGSKGSLYAPGTAKQLADWIVDGQEADPYYDYRNFNAE
ncbi:MAG: NAD(P)/FAD-dependent oxidoreductase [Luteolibacter sp.]